jgi:RNA polymerase sigma factor (sigma-70 family)
VPRDGKADYVREEVWEGLYRRFQTPLRAYFRRRLSDRADADDLTQEVFIRLGRYPDRNGGDTIEAYVFKVASSVLNDWGRCRTSRCATAHHALADPSESSTIPSVLIEDRTPERVLVAKETIKGIEDALAQLNQRTRDIFLLSRLENVQHREIASLYDISVSAVEKHVARAIAHIAAGAFRS